MSSQERGLSLLPLFKKTVREVEKESANRAKKSSAGGVETSARGTSRQPISKRNEPVDLRLQKLYKTQGGGKRKKNDHPRNPAVTRRKAKGGPRAPFSQEKKKKLRSTAQILTTERSYQKGAVTFGRSTSYRRKRAKRKGVCRRRERKPPRSGGETTRSPATKVSRTH